MSAWLTIIGVGEGGVADLPARLRSLVAEAEVVIGPERFLSALTPTPTPAPAPSPQGRGEPDRPVGQTAVEWTPPLKTMLAQVESFRGRSTVILATGDPMWFGIGATLANHVAPDEFEVYPARSAFELAAAKMRWPLQHVATISLHGRPAEALHPDLTPANRILALTTDRHTVAHVQRILDKRGFGDSAITVLEDLGGANERIGPPPAAGDFYVLAIECVADSTAGLLPPVPGLPDDAFVSDGQLTKREVRAATLAKLAPYPGALLWDVGAGCGSVAIEWMRAARDARAIAFEREGERLQMIAVNAENLGTPTIRIENGDAPENLAGMPAPDAIFLGGSVGDDTLFDACWQALKPGGRLVANAVTLDGEAALIARCERIGGELSRIAVSVLDTVGGHRAFRPRMTVTQWLVVKP